MSKVLVYGGSGALGSALCKAFREKNWIVYSVDGMASSEANHSVLIDFKNEAKQQFHQAREGLEKNLPSGEKLNAIINVAGGWAGGNVSEESFFDSSDLMWKQSVFSSLVSTHLASKFLQDDGLFVLTGAASALSGTSYCVGYGMAKAAIHQLVASLAQKNSGLPSNAKAICIAPVMLDTPGNRSGMPGADTSSWTPLSDLASILIDWASGAKSVTSGTIYQIKTENGKTTF
ncbi:hypothetical protein DSO57_1025887 [Entomophthora muscae]|uniref:Uncharacterized protein n=1 Tax=Entomophthora muscae TaxID=34485 RepID=A0ACC2UBY6_9FUNG|nr:hypothetical protein DSO57_1025887 [Entomophthora muscae]